MRKFTAKQYLQIDIANSFGLDKEVWDTRLAWTARMGFEHMPLNQVQELSEQADEPAQFLAGVLAYQAALRGESIGYLCGLDATASGLQLLALLAGCEQSAARCNLINTGRREDAYTSLYEAIKAAMPSLANIPRKPVKDALMTHLYSSKAVPERVFGEGTEELAEFYRQVNLLLPGANTLNHDLFGLWRSDVLSNDWTLPDGFVVKVKVMGEQEHNVTLLGETFTIKEKVNTPQAEGRSLGANIVHSLDGMVVREMNRRCNYTPEQTDKAMAAVLMREGTSTLRQKDLDLLRILELFEQTHFMSAVVLEYLDEHNAGHLDDTQHAAVIQLLMSFPNKPFPIICIHDAFKFHPNYGNDVREQYVNILAQLAQSITLSSIVEQVSGKAIQVTKLSNRLPQLILESEYALS